MWCGVVCGLHRKIRPTQLWVELSWGVAIKAFATDVIFMKGCKEDQNLPVGWKFKKVKHPGRKRTIMFLPPSSIKFISKNAKLEYLKANNFSESEIDKVTHFCKKIEVLKSKHIGHTWSSDGTVPKGWKYRMIKAKNGKRIMYFQTKE